jgi:hypothetical protein
MFITSTYMYQNHTHNNEKATVDEVISIVKNLRDSDLKKCNVILDILTGTIIKCRNFRLYDEIFVNSLNAPDYQRILNYFQSVHPKEIELLLGSIQQLNRKTETIEE